MLLSWYRKHIELLHTILKVSMVISGEKSNDIDEKNTDIMYIYGET